jgi:hypothetical protein
VIEESKRPNAKNQRRTEMMKLNHHRKPTWLFCVLLLLPAMLILPFPAKLVAEEMQDDAEDWRLAPGDVLEIYVETITEIRKSTDADDHLPPQMGYTVPIRDDGKITLPKLIHPLTIEGMTVAETQRLLRRAYIDVLQILSEEAVITVSLISSENPLLRNPLFDRLNETVSCDYGGEYTPEVSLQLVLDRLSEKTAIPFVISDEVVKALGAPQKSSVHARLPFHPPLKNALDFFVRQHDLAWHCKDGTIYITDKTSDPARKLVYRAYYVRDLARTAGIQPLMSDSLPEYGDVQGIADYIRAMIAPEFWNEETSLTPVFPGDSTSTILVRQTESVHAQIVKLLIDLRKLRHLPANQRR